MRLLVLLALTGAVIAADVSTTVDRGLAALAKLQGADGSYHDQGIPQAATALAGMAFLAGGHTPNRGTYHAASARCLTSLLARQDPATGYLGGGDAGRMYAHGFATLYLAEVYGMTSDGAVRRALEAAVDCIHRSQNREGGWRYNPVPEDADISVTICQVMALRAAHNAGIGGAASQDAIGRAVAYVRRCANGDGSFSYVAGGGMSGEGPEGVPRAAAGTMCLIGAGITDPADATLGPALRFLAVNAPLHLRQQPGQHYFWYGQYYTAQAIFHHPDPAAWDTYWADASRIIAGHQGAQGLWTASESPGGQAYATAMALIILQIPNHYLPIFQR
jgi:hypothetical protein